MFNGSPAHQSPGKLLSWGKVFRLSVPPMVVFLLFVITIYCLALPLMRENFFAIRKDTVRVLTRLAWDITVNFENQGQQQPAGSDAFRKRTLDLLRTIQRRPGQTECIWVCSLEGTILMNPYRPDLEGKSLRDALDETSLRTITAAIAHAQHTEDAVFEYFLPHREGAEAGLGETKIGCVRVFAPWNWVIGTSLSMSDVQAELSSATRQLMLVSLGILLIVGGISAYIMGQSMHAERRRHEAEQMADMQQQQLIHAGKMVALGTLVAGVAHEINNPNQHIMMSAGLLARAWDGALPVLDQYLAEHGDYLIGGLYYSELRQNVNAYANSILDGSARIRAIVDELRDFSRQEPMGGFMPVNCNEIIRSSMLLLANLIKRSTRHFEVELDESCPCVHGSFRRLEQVVINLIQNACQALPNPDCAIRVSTTCKREAHAVIVEVFDEGTGIPEEDIDKIFYPFFTTRRASGGTGLGLSISLRIVEEHHGTLTFTSEPGKGTSARLTLPIAPQENPAAGNGKERLE